MTEQQFLQKLLEQLESVAEMPTEMRQMKRRYARFTHRVAFALTLLFTAVGVFVFGVIPHQTDQVEASRRAALEQVCRDQKTLLALVPADYPPLIDAIAQHPDSSLNPNRNCRDFATRAINKR